MPATFHCQCVSQYIYCDHMHSVRENRSTDSIAAIQSSHLSACWPLVESPEQHSRRCRWLSPSLPPSLPVSLQPPYDVERGADGRAQLSVDGHRHADIETRKIRPRFDLSRTSKCGALELSSAQRVQALKLSSAQALKLSSAQALKLSSSQALKLSSAQALKLSSSQALKLSSSRASARALSRYQAQANLSHVVVQPAIRPARVQEEEPLQPKSVECPGATRATRHACPALSAHSAGAASNPTPWSSLSGRASRVCMPARPSPLTQPEPRAPTWVAREARAGAH
jgi:hypothetical protein